MACLIWQECGLEPDTVTFNALISACARGRQYDRAQHMYRDMQERGVSSDTYTFNSLLNACEKCGRWEEAFQLFDQMTSEGVIADTITYNTLISACEKGEQWEQAIKVGRLFEFSANAIPILCAMQFCVCCNHV